jgi:hypothetical protein
MATGFDAVAAVVLVVGLVVLASWWADALEDQARLREQPDLTGRLPEMYARPAALRRAK